MEIPRPPTREELVAATERTQERIETGAFHSEIDRKIASNVLNTLRVRGEYFLLSLDEVAEGAAALNLLIPQRDESGLRRIGNRILTPQHERAIASRLDCPEVDITAPDGAWGKLPETVKQAIASNNSPCLIELTDSCTVRCSFCDFANKQPTIGSKVSFESALQVVNYFDQAQQSRGCTVWDSFYWGTDPFEAKWKGREGEEEKDYFDLAEDYYWIFGEQRQIATSTAVPIGEELRVLRFAIEKIGGNLRLSRTKTNKEQLDAIKRITEILGIPTVFNGDERGIAVNNITKRESLTGKRWQTAQDVGLFDILFPQCQDGTVISPRSVDRIAMTGCSPEKPNGQDRAPVGFEEGGRMVYEIVMPYKSPHYDGTDELHKMFPDVQIVRLDEANAFRAEDPQPVENDPHRHFLRLAGAFNYFLILRRVNKLDAVLGVDKYAFNKLFTDSYQLVEAYANDHDNWAMQWLLQAINREGLLLPKSN